MAGRRLGALEGVGGTPLPPLPMRPLEVAGQGWGVGGGAAAGGSGSAAFE